jgi:hypothetical protein
MSATRTIDTSRPYTVTKLEWHECKVLEVCGASCSVYGTRVSDKMVR